MVGKEFFNVTGNRTAIRSHFAFHLQPELDQAANGLTTAQGFAR